MPKIAALFALCFAAAPAIAAERPFDVRDLVALDRVADPRVSPDGRQVAFQVREADVDNNKATTGLWLRAVDGTQAPRRITAHGINSVGPRWSPDGRALYFLSSRSGSMQVWRLDLGGGEARQATDFPLDVGSFVLAPDGRAIALSFEVFAECGADLGCTKKKLDEEAASKPTGQLYDQLFVRHWDTWSDHRRSQLFVASLDAAGVAGKALAHVSKGIDGDVPSKPFGDDSEYAWSPDAHRWCSARASPARRSPGRPTSTCSRCRPTAAPRRAT